MTILLKHYYPKSLNTIMRDGHVYLKKQAAEEMERHLHEWSMTQPAEFRGTFNRYTPVLKCDYVRQIYMFKDNRDRDFDNFAGKVPFDVFKTNGIFKNDCSKIIGESRIKFHFGCKVNWGYACEIAVSGAQDFNASQKDVDVFNKYNKEVALWIPQDAN